MRLAEPADRSWVHYAPDNGLADVLDESCAAAGFRPQATQTAAAPLLAAGLGPLVPANVIPAQFDGFLLRPDPAVPPLAAYRRNQHDPLTTAFVDVLTRST
ncbi:hypothetical protein [Streptomyces sp. NPDC058240]|uniref:hypothetical protein n=1 Tax=Streptomyces sp. NPDC058240 TaxID=3346396 RepID=UPI0036E28828